MPQHELKENIKNPIKLANKPAIKTTNKRLNSVIITFLSSILCIIVVNLYNFHVAYVPSLHQEIDDIPINDIPKLIKVTRTCRQTYFWGGGKAGSSSLYYMLAHKEGGNFTPFVKEDYNDVGKEPCVDYKKNSEWSRWKTNVNDETICSIMNGTARFSHVLNGCPRHTQIRNAQDIITISNNSATFLMLIRDPVDILVSHINDERRRGRGGKDINVESFASKMARSKHSTHMRLSYQGLALKNLLSVIKDPSKVLIIPMESLTIDQQGVVDAIMDHIGAKRYTLNDHENGNRHVNQGSGIDSYKYVSLSNHTREMVRATLRDDVLLLEQLVGKQFSWSSWARESERNTDEGSWLVTTPNPRINTSNFE